jgi:calcineurin-like phosphoesterase family protein
MNQAIIDNWISRVGKNDIVYHLGDVGFGSQDDVIAILKKLPGKKVLIIGNHDRRIKKNSWFCEQFVEVCLEPKEIKFNERSVLLGHKPKAQVDADYQIYGHIHNKVIDMKNAYNAGVEVNGYMPVTFEELVSNNLKFSNEFRDTDYVVNKEDYFSGNW